MTMNYAIRTGLFIIIFLFLPVLTQQAFAACSFYNSMSPSSKNVSNWNTSCTVSAVDGVDDAANIETSVTNTAVLTLTSGGSITILNGAVLRLGSLIISGGNVAIAAGGQMLTRSPLWVTDANGDGIADNWTVYNATAAATRPPTPPTWIRVIS